jgi:hypothetical protein
MSDDGPYRTMWRALSAAELEYIYWNMAAGQTPSDPIERAEAFKRLERARGRWLDKLDEERRSRR